MPIPRPRTRAKALRRRRRPRASARVIGAAALCGLALASCEAVGQTAKVSPALGQDYAKAHEAIDIGGGRRLNLFCMGSGRQTVLFDAGGSDWSDVWALVQPAIAEGGARACAYDRAGLGHSDPSPLPRTPVAIVDDMRALIAAAKLRTPLVLVGHSLGGFHVKLYAALYPDDVAGLVLVDPSEERAAERVGESMIARFGERPAARAELLDQTFITFLMERYRRCAEAARQGPMDPQSQIYRRCSDPVRAPLGPEVAATRLRIQPTVNYQAAQASEVLNSVYGDPRGGFVYARLFQPGAFGDKPMIVLTHGSFNADDPMDAIGQASGIALHEQTAKLSRNGRHRVVPDTGHYIQLDDPKAVIKAITEVLKEVEARPGR